MKIILICSLLFPSLLIAGEISFHNDDAALINHIKSTDYVFTTALGECRSEEIIRDGNNFEYTAVCKANAAKESDCPEYKVKAKGTVDTNSWATVREFMLELLCNG